MHTVTTVVQVEYRADMAPYTVETELLGKAGAELVVTRGDTLAEVLPALEAADVAWLEWTPHLTADALAAMPRCGLAMRWGVGYEQIDVAAATELGIAVANAPTYCTIDVAEHALALILASTRAVVDRHEQLRRGEWRDSPPRQRRLAGSTVGLVGLGRIGRRLASLLVAMGVQVIGYDEFVTDVPGVTPVPFDELFARSDVVSVHVPLTAQTAGLIGSRALGLARPGLVLVNTSRGPVVDEAALVAALADGRLAGAALDVFATEPLPPGSGLRSLPNVILTPHEGAFSPESMHDLRLELCSTTVAWLAGEWPGNIVNPEVRDHPRQRARREA